jgi:type I restriction enzyme S subunit
MSDLVAISEVACINPTTPKFLALDGDRKVCFLPMAGVSENGYITEVEERPLRNVVKGYRYFERGDVLIAKITPCMENGKAAYADTLLHQIGFGSTEFHVLRPGPDVDGRYLFYMVWNPHFRFAGKRNMTGTAGQKRLPTGFLENFKIPLPPLSKQRRIAAILDKADAIHQKRQEAILLMEEFLHSVFSDMFGNIGNFDHVKIQDIASKKKHALSSGPFGSNLTSAHYTNEGIIVLRGLNISKGRLNLDDVKFVSEQKAQSLVRSEVRPGDIVVVAVGSSGLACQIPNSLPRAIMSQNFNKISPNLNKTNPIYLEYCINSLFVQRQLKKEITDTVRTFLSLTKLKNVEIPLPPLRDQEKFAQVVRKSAQLRTKHQRAERKSDAIFNSLVQRAFRGEL